VIVEEGVIAARKSEFWWQTLARATPSPSPITLSLNHNKPTSTQQQIQQTPLPHPSSVSHRQRTMQRHRSPLCTPETSHRPNHYRPRIQRPSPMSAQRIQAARRQQSRQTGATRLNRAGQGYRRRLEADHRSARPPPLCAGRLATFTRPSLQALHDCSNLSKTPN
jgi:hypothetical protein